MTKSQEWRNIALLGRFSVESRKQRGLGVSEAHHTSHLRMVAELTQKVTDLYGFTPQEKKLAYIAGWFHDFVRSPSEDPATGDEEASAKEAYRVLIEANERGVIVTNDKERKALAYAIENHGHYPEWLSKPATRDKLPETLEEKLHLALFVADKMEANGVRVIARRSQFVAGDRLRSTHGDLRNFGFQPDRDEALVVAIESFLRLSFINPEEIYPRRLKSIVGPLYEVQREFVRGLCRGLNLTVKDVARLLLETRTDQGRNILQARKISAPESISELAELLASKSGITDGIASVSDDLTSSSLETVEYFSHRYQEDLSQLIFNWKPQGQKAREWQRAMREYEEVGLRL